MLQDFCRAHSVAGGRGGGRTLTGTLGLNKKSLLNILGIFKAL